MILFFNSPALSAGLTGIANRFSIGAPCRLHADAASYIQWNSSGERIANRCSFSFRGNAVY
jgi:hypothetical protein